MRVIEEIPHPQLKITIFGWNEKYILKFEAGQYEQSYKISQLDVMGVDELKEMITPEFLAKVMDRFTAMSKDFLEEFRKLNQ
ncbi:MAG: hypothetical protein ACK4K0_08650 [Flavobacteriales bacterium]